jgi:glycerol-3-phosphate dehydrogenase (NAD(P)+)
MVSDIKKIYKTSISIAVIGGGSWATAIVKILSENDVQIAWWLRSEKDRLHIEQTGHNPRYLSGVSINLEKVTLATTPAQAIENAHYVVLAVPAAFVKGVLLGIDPNGLRGKRIVSAIKGMIPIENMLITDWLEQYYGTLPKDMSIIAGPCHAEEVALEKQSYLTIACPDKNHANDFSDLLRCRYVMANPIDDIYGVEYCAVMKNIIALACGICHGLGYGDNFQAVLVSNALQEIQAFLDAVHAHYRDLFGSAYLGDLLVTAYSPFSRNRTFGNLIGKGYSVLTAQNEMNMVAEGYYAVRCIWEINQQFNVSMPITQATYEILYEQKSAIETMETLKYKLK